MMKFIKKRKEKPSKIYVTGVRPYIKIIYPKKMEKL